MKLPRRLYYKLDGQRVVPCHDLLDWARWFETCDRHVALTQFDPGIKVSTVFLGLDHRFFGGGPPLLFETMVFGISAEDGDMQRRYSSWDDAQAGHQATVRKVKELLVKAARSKTEQMR